ncbi:MAG TPA: N-acetyl-D-Glu racemase DgcA [Thermohalobaculum sp.]|nr:N-acetyl-D-Glu racemase DgcA [Thermohalobaculum sp.]
MALSARIERFPTAGAWTISRGSVSEVEVVTAEARLGEAVGRGECRPYARYDEFAGGVVADIEAAARELGDDPETVDLAAIMAPGAARNAVDCALWDLRAKLAGRRVWELAGLPEPGPVITAYSLSLDTPGKMRTKAAENAHRPLLKVKLGGEADLERIRAVRAGAPEAKIIVDANEGWTADAYAELAPELLALGVAMVEQPLPAWDDGALAGIERPLPVCADEACHDTASLEGLAGKYDMVNIKLDKTGGLSEAIRLKAEAERLGLRVMVGCMLASSLAMAPAVLLAQGAEIVDLDGPLLLARDRDNPLKYDEMGVHPPSPALWG